MTKNVLIVDDLEIERITTRRILEKEGYRVYEASDGKRGLELAKEKLPDLILMDVVMPETNGFQALRMLKKDPSTKHIPVVMVTTKDREPDRMNADDNGASGYVVKPVNDVKLMQQITRVFAEA